MSPEIGIVVVRRIVPHVREGKADAFQRAGGSNPGSDKARAQVHHRGLRPGHAFTGVGRELGRAVGLLARIPEEEVYRVNNRPGGQLPPDSEPETEHKQRRQARYRATSDK